MAGRPKVYDTAAARLQAWRRANTKPARRPIWLTDDEVRELLAALEASTMPSGDLLQRLQDRLAKV